MESGKGNRTYRGKYQFGQGTDTCVKSKLTSTIKNIK